MQWGPPAPQATALERSVAELRKRPVSELTGWELARLIGQHVGLPFLVPHSVNRLIAERDQGLTFLDDDLLTALLSCGDHFRDSDPALARRLLSFIESLDEKGPYLPPLVERFQEVVKR
ncbi:contact-dependent growth inhibition system immunity protein [Streptomyces sp. NPDC059897]|uniref:contact-dependent growth inhibition system immunity protein n=1 Tax=Streptomyces sp. NPDC059897 TaxID=3346994 RepID=UPI00365E2EC1